MNQEKLKLQDEKFQQGFKEYDFVKDSMLEALREYDIIIDQMCKSGSLGHSMKMSKKASVNSMNN